MYRISNQKRKYSATPIVYVTVGPDGKEMEEMVLVAVQTKKLGDAISQKVVDLLNREESEQEYRSQLIERAKVNEASAREKYLEMQKAIGEQLSLGQTLSAMKIYKDTTGCSLQEAKDYILSINKKS